MAEFCLNCFVKIFRPTKNEVDRIVMSGHDDLDICEGCGKYDQYVLYIDGGQEEHD